MTLLSEQGHPIKEQGSQRLPFFDEVVAENGQGIRTGDRLMRHDRDSQTMIPLYDR